MFSYCANNPVRYIDFTGLYHVEGTDACGVTMRYTTGAASEYVELPNNPNEPENYPNCFTYALKIYDHSENPIPDNITSSPDEYSVDIVCDMTIEYINNNIPNTSARPIKDAFSYVHDDEYRIALRITDPERIQENMYLWDYHFMVQNSDGSWSAKSGLMGKTITRNVINPDRVPWDARFVNDHYRSETRYIAIKKG